MRRILATALMAGLCAGGAHAQLFRRAPVVNSPPVAAPPTNLSPDAAEIWPFPEPDPRTWWTDKRPRLPEAADPLGGRRIPYHQHVAVIQNGIDPSTYRLWGLMPLQWQVLYPGEMILEVWVRPMTNVREAVVRVIVRRDGQAFVEARAGLACCEADISRRIGFDRQLPPGSAATFLRLRDEPMWRSPRMVQVAEPGAAEGLCVDGVAYDVTLAVPGRSWSLHRECDDAAIGQVADALEPTIKAALGHDPRFDVLFPHGGDFSVQRKIYQDLIAGGGSLKPSPVARLAPPGAEPAPRPEARPPATPAAPPPRPGPAPAPPR
ncbi:MAG: hypothetical protein KGO51_05085 [Alphaproteobacteria bacterium]|nr:hypothetical protein [Alphaproteobacteria bacterium]